MRCIHTCCSVKVVRLRRCLRRAKPSSFSSGCSDSGYDVSDDASVTIKHTRHCLLKCKYTWTKIMAYFGLKRQCSLIDYKYRPCRRIKYSLSRNKERDQGQERTIWSLRTGWARFVRNASSHSLYRVKLLISGQIQTLTATWRSIQRFFLRQ